MRRWGIAFLIVVLSCVPILLRRATSPTLLQDTDTAVLLRAIRERDDPLSWFSGDWPLQNHFYRPISTLFFELDNRLYGDDAAGYGLTNALLCVACVLLLFWFVRELSDSPFVAGASAVLFAVWHIGTPDWLFTLLEVVLLLTLMAGICFHRTHWKAYAPALLVLWYLGYEVAGIEPLYSRMVAWLPGRTASIMTVFVLISLAAYARYERTTATRDPKPPPGPLDPPATKSTEVDLVSRKAVGWPWAVLSVLALWLALGSYEQAVMLPAVLLGVALTLRFQRYRPRYGWQAVFWLSLLGYLLLRYRLVPSDTSGYQEQQLRSSLEGVWLALTDYVLPALATIRPLVSMLQEGLILLVTAQPWLILLNIVAQVTTFVQARRRWVLALFGWLASILAFLPMAWLKPFEHYHYWPMAMRSVLAVTLVLVAKDLLATAWSRPSRQAPPRHAPAPGSLPRP